MLNVFTVFLISPGKLRELFYNMALPLTNPVLICKSEIAILFDDIYVCWLKSVTKYNETHCACQVEDGGWLKFRRTGWFYLRIKILQYFYRFCSSKQPDFASSDFHEVTEILLPGVGKLVQPSVLRQHQLCVRFKSTCRNSPWSNERDFPVSASYY